jgi:hypothetical protein
VLPTLNSYEQGNKTSHHKVQAMFVLVMDANTKWILIRQQNISP